MTDENEIKREFDEIILNINDEEVIVDIDDELVIHDVSVDQSKVAAQMAYWSTVWAAAEAERIRIDAFYRKWRAEYGEAILNADAKKSEWKVKQQVESDEKFVKLKDALAEATKNSIISKGVFESFRIKANALQSKGAMLRAELDSTGMTTREKKGAEERKEKTDEKVERMRKIFTSKK